MITAGKLEWEARRRAARPKCSSTFELKGTTRHTRRSHWNENGNVFISGWELCEGCLQCEGSTDRPGEERTVEDKGGVVPCKLAADEKSREQLGLEPQYDENVIFKQWNQVNQENVRWFSGSHKATLASPNSWLMCGCRYELCQLVEKVTLPFEDVFVLLTLPWLNARATHRYTFCLEHQLNKLCWSVSLFLGSLLWLNV